MSIRSHLLSIIRTITLISERQQRARAPQIGSWSNRSFRDRLHWTTLVSDYIDRAAEPLIIILVQTLGFAFLHDTTTIIIFINYKIVSRIITSLHYQQTFYCDVYLEQAEMIYVKHAEGKTLEYSESIIGHRKQAPFLFHLDP